MSLASTPGPLLHSESPRWLAGPTASVLQWEAQGLWGEEEQGCR